jgi:hypothetical protein
MSIWMDVWGYQLWLEGRTLIALDIQLNRNVAIRLHIGSVRFNTINTYTTDVTAISI